MYIISKFKDYYDSLISTYGVDKSLIYKRDYKFVTIDDKLADVFSYKNAFAHNYSFRRMPDIMMGDYKSNEYVYSFLLSFCNKTHYFEVVSGKYDYTKMKFITNIYYKHDLLNILEERNKGKSPRELKHSRTTKDAARDIEKLEAISFMDMHRAFNCPILILNYGQPRRYDFYPICDDASESKEGANLWLNPCLRNIRFQTIVPPEIAFQEIAMFMSGVLGKPETPVLKIDDKYKIQAAGFDLKTSFRKEKEIE